jgi:hypothetical protein
MTGLNDDEVLAVMGMRAMPVGRHFAANPPMVEWERPEMLGKKNDRVALTFIGAKGA